MTEEKGLDPATADKIGEYVKHKGAQLAAHCPIFRVVDCEYRRSTVA